MNTAAATASDWDRWEAQALAAGVPAHLASLGSAVMRDVASRGDDPSITLGAADDAQLLLDMMLTAPLSAEHRLLSDQKSRAGVDCDDVFQEALEQIARRLHVDPDVVEGRLDGERDALKQVWARNNAMDASHA
jgi:hypothetical protein